MVTVYHGIDSDGKSLTGNYPVTYLCLPTLHPGTDVIGIGYGEEGKGRGQRPAAARISGTVSSLPMAMM